MRTVITAPRLLFPVELGERRSQCPYSRFSVALPARVKRLHIPG